MSTHDKPPPTEHILQFFACDHLPAHLKAVSQPFAELATFIMTLPRSPERTVALRKTLEAKDAAVRACLIDTPPRGTSEEAAPAVLSPLPRAVVIAQRWEGRQDTGYNVTFHADRAHHAAYVTHFGRAASPPTAPAFEVEVLGDRAEEMLRAIKDEGKCVAVLGERLMLGEGGRMVYFP